MNLNLQEEKLTFSEIDIPPEGRHSSNETSSMSSQKMSKKDIENYEKKQQIDLKDFISRKGFRLLVYILIAMVAMVIFDTIATNQGWSQSEHFSTIIDFGKYTATMLLGFLFANHGNKE